MSDHDLLVVANRLPVDRQEQPDGSFTWQPSPGGLVSALEPVMRARDGAWIGWAGTAGEVPEEIPGDGLRLIPLHLDADDVEHHYEGMCNATLWPLYHDVIVPPVFHRHWWDAYVRVNRRFAERTVELAAPGATVWVQDYQLQLVPGMLRARRPDLRIGFFNHIPFPPFELFAQLPWRRQVLLGLLGADLLGFQRPGDANNLLRACRRFGLVTRGTTVRVPAVLPGAPGAPPGTAEALSTSHRAATASTGALPAITGAPPATAEALPATASSTSGAPRDGGLTAEHEAKVGSFPISVDARAFDELARDPGTRARAAEIRRELGDPHVLLLGVDRLDYTKGIAHRLQAVGELFDEGRLATPSAVFVQVATPSRERVRQYQDMRDEVEGTVGRINGMHAQLGHPAVHYLHQFHSRAELSALYLAADVLLVTSLRDGMNLVAKEYVASRFDERGALVLSEFTGAVNELHQAFLVNPHDIDGLKSAIEQAVAVSRREAQRRMRALRRRVFGHDVAHWADSFLRALDQVAGTFEGTRRPGSEGTRRPVTGELLTGDDGTAPLGSRSDAAGALPGPGSVPEAVGASAAGAAEESADASGDAGGSAVERDPALDVALAELVERDRFLVAVDFDGVLAPLVPDPAQARALPEATTALQRLSTNPGVEVAIVSGREVTDLRTVADPPRGVRLLGSHGAQQEDAEPPPQLSPAEAALWERLAAEVRRITAAHPGTRVELKPLAVVLHTRTADRSVARRATREVLDGPATWPGVHVLPGSEVVELSVRESSKGAALQVLRDRLGLGDGGVLFIGDDLTDERAFAALRDSAGDVTVKVGPGQTAARHRLRGPTDVARLLAHLAELSAV